MSAPDLLQAMRNAGLILTVADGRLLVKGPADALDWFRPTIRDQRNELLRALSISTADVVVAYRCWSVHYPDRESVEVSCTPPATHGEILERHPEAIAAEPVASVTGQSWLPLTAQEEVNIRTWLVMIEETDPATIADVIEQCQRDGDSRDYFIGRSATRKEVYSLTRQFT